MTDGPRDIVALTPVKYFWPQWYVRGDERTGRVWHWGPYTEWAAYKLVPILWERLRYEGRSTALVGGATIQG